MSDCPKHPELDTMVPCLGCGRSFCRLCHPPKGAGQYCPACYEAQLERLSGDSKPAAGERAGVRPRRARRKKAPQEVAAAAPTVAKEKKRRKGLVEWLRSPVDVANTWVGALGRRLEAAGAWIGALPGRFAKWVSKQARALALFVKKHFPVGLAAREALEGEPPFGSLWPKLVGFVFGGAFIWATCVAIARFRNPGFSIGVAIIVAGLVVWGMGVKFGIKVAIVSTGVALVSLAIGELAVQLLYRAQVIITRLDLQKAGLVSLDNPWMYYRTYAFRLIVYRMLPSAVVAFMIGWWPLSRRLSWVGFAARPVRGSDSAGKAKRRRMPRRGRKAAPEHVAPTSRPARREPKAPVGAAPLEGDTGGRESQP